MQAHAKSHPRVRPGWWLMTYLLLAGCSLQADDSQAEALPAVIAEPSAASTLELERTIATLLQMQKVTLAAGAFTQNPNLTLARLEHKDANGVLIMGRDYESPRIVQLLIKDGQCLLADEQGKQSPPLTDTRCKRAK